MVDDEVNSGERVDLGGITAHADHRIAHGGEIDDRRNAGEILHQNPGRAIGDFLGALLLFQPFGNRSHILGIDGATVFIAEQVLKQHFQGERQAGNIAQLLGCGLEAVIAVGFAIDRQFTAGIVGGFRGGQGGLLEVRAGPRQIYTPTADRVA